MSGAREKEPWHLDKRVPLALIVTIFVQTFIAGGWLAHVEARLDAHDRAISTLSGQDAAISAEARRIGELLARLDERLAAQQAVMLRLEASLHRAYQGGRVP